MMVAATSCILMWGFVLFGMRACGKGETVIAVLCVFGVVTFGVIGLSAIAETQSGSTQSDGRGL